MDDIDMITAINEWPRWPLLPLKRPRDDRSMPDHALLIDCTPMDVDSGTQFDLYENVNLFAIPADLISGKREPNMTYFSAQDVLNDGWRVD
jgi:hypothetical protein